jgi:hypothetical protein
VSGVRRTSEGLQGDPGSASYAPSLRSARFRGIRARPACRASPSVHGVGPGRHTTRTPDVPRG